MYIKRVHNFYFCAVCKSILHRKLQVSAMLKVSSGPYILRSKHPIQKVYNTDTKRQNKGNTWSPLKIELICASSVTYILQDKILRVFGSNITWKSGSEGIGQSLNKNCFRVGLDVPSDLYRGCTAGNESILLFPPFLLQRTAESS